MGLVVGGEEFVILGLLSFARPALKVPVLSQGYVYKWGVAACMWVKADAIYHSEATDLGIDPVLLKGPLLPCRGKSLDFPKPSER